MSKVIQRVVPSKDGAVSISPDLARRLGLTIGDPPAKKRQQGDRPTKRRKLRVTYNKGDKVQRGLGDVAAGTLVHLPGGHREQATRKGGGGKPVPLSAHQVKKAKARQPYGGKSLGNVAGETLTKLPGGRRHEQP